MATTDRVDRFQRRHRTVGFPLAVLYKYIDDQGNYLAALITYYGFLSLFPLLLILASVLGFALRGQPELQQRVLDSTLSQFPIIGDAIGNPEGLRGSGTALVVGGLVALYGALGVAQALQNATNVMWAVPRNRRPNPLKARLRSLALIGIGGIAVLATTALSALGSSASALGADFGRSVTLGAPALAAVLNVAVFVLTFRISTARRLRLGELLPGAILAAAVWQLLQLFGTALVANVLRGAGSTYGVFALVLGLLAWIYLAAVGIVLAVEVNVVHAKRLYPRGVLSIFTDDVDLTTADRRTYGDIARAQRFKDFQSVEVAFADDGLLASDRSASQEVGEPALPPPEVVDQPGQGVDQPGQGRQSGHG